MVVSLKTLKFNSSKVSGGYTGGYTICYTGGYLSKMLKQVGGHFRHTNVKYGGHSLRTKCLVAILSTQNVWWPFSSHKCLVAILSTQVKR